MRFDFCSNIHYFLKIVAYCKKTTGSLHKHPCASDVQKFWSKSLKRRKKGENGEKKMNDGHQNQHRYDGHHYDQNGQIDYNRGVDNVSLSNIQQASLYGSNNLFNMNKSQQNLDAMNHQGNNILVRFSNDLGNGQSNPTQPGNNIVLS